MAKIKMSKSVANKLVSKAQSSNQTNSNKLINSKAGLGMAYTKSENPNKWIVIDSDMDGLIAYQVVHSLDANQVRSGCYSGNLVKDLSLDKAKMQKVADKLNAKNVPAPENPFRNVRF